MNLDKARSRIAKQVKKVSKGYPTIAIKYFGTATDCATQVMVEFVAEEGAQPQSQIFEGKTDVRKDEVIQTTLVKIIERADANTVTEATEVALLK
ncbi:hypothetical protein Q4508_02805 [Amphritea sp. 2_MG-2023]|jgi:hypothetical protein|uniref:hypothetical protein n=1 Tax=Amphritea TaxID=515417 RepID=UPI001C077DC0|nr:MULTISPECIES: hypothetical protein [Amphritea]MBU2966659.1 hypothetical protein [Amphritea atlantica]MDO6417482.1 hypothetical protein [Amphritea sp. 2_MG-2023]MDX2423023.1 hypothetical protein [Amphritea sp.]